MFASPWLEWTSNKETYDKKGTGEVAPGVSSIYILSC
jgi:hypothetical protein